MSALPHPHPPLLLRPMKVAALDAVLAVERDAYEFPWSRGNFVDSLAAGYVAEVLTPHDAASLRGYFVAMAGVEELHLLNLTVAPAWQGRGYSRLLLDGVVGHAERLSARSLWLEVRTSNAKAQAAYQRYGFSHIGMRRGYYPAANQKREDALVMRLRIGAARAGASNDDLD